MKLRSLLCGVGLFLVSGAVPSWAATQIPMVQVASTYPSGYTGSIGATIDERGQGLESFLFKDSRGTEQTFTLDQLRQGVVLVHAAGKDILKIASPGFSAADGGQIVLTFLRGFFGSDRREVRFDYVRHGAMDDWLLTTDDAQGKEPFNILKVVVSKSLGVPSGIAAITLLRSDASGTDQKVRQYDPGQLPHGTLILKGVWPDTSFEESLLTR